MAMNPMWRPFLENRPELALLSLPGHPGQWSRAGAIKAGLVREWDERFAAYRVEGRRVQMGDEDRKRDAYLYR